MWYNERDDGSPQGGIILKDAPEMMAVGQVSRSFKRDSVRYSFPNGIMPKNDL